MNNMEYHIKKMVSQQQHPDIVESLIIYATIIKEKTFVY